MIYLDIIASFEKALGTSLDTDCRHSVMQQLAADLGGERHYFGSLPKLRMQVLVDGSGDANAELVARKLNVSSRYVRQLRKVLRG